MTNTDPNRFTPAQLMEEWNVKSDAYYDRLRYLQIKAKKDENRKAFLEEPEVYRLRSLHDWIQKTGAMDGFKEHEQELNQSQESNEESGELAVSNGNGKIAQQQDYDNDEEIRAAVTGQSTDRRTLQKFDRLAQQSAAAALIEAREILTGEYVRDPNKLDEDLQKQVFFEENPQSLGRAWMAKNLAEAIKAQRKRS